MQHGIDIGSEGGDTYGAVSPFSQPNSHSSAWSLAAFHQAFESGELTPRNGTSMQRARKEEGGESW